MTILAQTTAINQTNSGLDEILFTKSEDDTIAKLTAQTIEAVVLPHPISVQFMDRIKILKP